MLRLHGVPLGLQRRQRLVESNHLLLDVRVGQLLHEEEQGCVNTFPCQCPLVHHLHASAYRFVVLPPGDQHIQLLLENSQLLANSHIRQEVRITAESGLNCPAASCMKGVKVNHLQQLLVGCHRGEIFLLLGFGHRLDHLVGGLPLSADVLLNGPDCLLPPASHGENRVSSCLVVSQRDNVCFALFNQLTPSPLITTKECTDDEIRWQR